MPTSPLTCDTTANQSSSVASAPSAVNQVPGTCTAAISAAPCSTRQRRTHVPRHGELVFLFGLCALCGLCGESGSRHFCPAAISAAPRSTCQRRKKMRRSSVRAPSATSAPSAVNRVPGICAAAISAARCSTCQRPTHVQYHGEPVLLCGLCALCGESGTRYLHRRGLCGALFDLPTSHSRATLQRPGFLCDLRALCGESGSRCLRRCDLCGALLDMPTSQEDATLQRPGSLCALCGLCGFAPLSRRGRTETPRLSRRRSRATGCSARVGRRRAGGRARTSSRHRAARRRAPGLVRLDAPDPRGRART